MQFIFTSCCKITDTHKYVAKIIWQPAPSKVNHGFYLSDFLRSMIVTGDLSTFKTLLADKLCGRFIIKLQQKRDQNSTGQLAY
jgi:hypothetical protein